MPSPSEQGISLVHEQLERLLQRQGAIAHDKWADEVVKMGIMPEHRSTGLRRLYDDLCKPSVCLEGVELTVNCGDLSLVIRGVPYQIDKEGFVLKPYMIGTQGVWRTETLSVPIETIIFQSKLKLTSPVARTANPAYNSKEDVA